MMSMSRMLYSQTELKPVSPLVGWNLSNNLAMRKKAITMRVASYYIFCLLVYQLYQMTMCYNPTAQRTV